MIQTILLAVAIVPGISDGTFNYTGKLTDFLPEGAAWGMPYSGLPMQIVIAGPDKVGPSSFSLKGPRWSQECKLDLGALKFDGSSLSGTVQFNNSSGAILDAVRFDIVSATEAYKGKDSQGKDVELTRTQAIKQDSPILFGDMLKDTSFEGASFHASGLKWNPETVSLSVTAKLSGLTFVRSLWDEHSGSFLDFDTKGRLLLGSGKQPAIYRGDSNTGKLEVLTSTPESSINFDVNPMDGSICAVWLNSHNFTIYSSSGEEKGVIEESDVDGMRSWPGMGRYDGKGNLFLEFGSTIAQFSGGKPMFVLKSAGQFEFQEYTHFDVSQDGTLFVATGSNVFRFDPGGKNPKKIVQGPDDHLGRIHNYSAIRVDPNGYLWVAEVQDSTVFPQRISVFDSNGKFVWAFGRGGPKQLEGGEVHESQVTAEVKSMAISKDGRVFIATNGAHSVLEFAAF